MQPHTTQATYFFRLLVNKYYSGKPDSVAKLLPKEQAEKLARCLSPLKTPHAALCDSKAWLSSCDPSWFVPTLNKLPEPLQEVYARVLPEDMHIELPKGSAKAISLPMEHFLLSYLHTLWKEEEVLPKELLHKGDLVSLLDLTKQELLEIIDLLSMYDLVDEMRHIVDKRVLQSISQLLSVPQQQYLRMCLRQKTKAYAPSFTLRELLKEPKNFGSLLHKQGLKRFALALSGEEKDFVWHIIHTLDLDNGNLVKQSLRPEAVGHATRMAQLEILQILQFLKVGSKS